MASKCTKHTDIKITCTIGTPTSASPPSNRPIATHFQPTFLHSIVFRNSFPPATIMAGWYNFAVASAHVKQVPIKWKHHLHYG